MLFSVRVLNSLCNITDSHHHPTEPPATPAVCSSLHDYEYVHYPCLVDGVKTRPVTPKGELTLHTSNIMGDRPLARI